MTAAVSLQNACKIYNKIPVVNDLSFTIEAGEMFGLLGPNGAGKSTTIRMLTTLTKPSSGQIQVAGYDVMRQSLQVKQSIGVVLQQTALLIHGMNKLFARSYKTHPPGSDSNWEILNSYLYSATPNKLALIMSFLSGKIWSFTGGCTTSPTRNGNSRSNSGWDM
jgi:ABC-type dipeptide/oligopeptide/nickel transport system ATPase subunit